MLVARQSGYCVEIEIKRSLSDLKADFKKHEHKHSLIKELYYAVPEKIRVKAEELIPVHAGIITFYRGYAKISELPYTDMKIIRKAVANKDARPLSFNETQHLAVLGTMRIWKLKRTIFELKERLKT